MTQQVVRKTSWPEGTKYCVHIFKAGNPPTLVRRVFTPTLVVPDAPYPDFRLRKSKARGWWQHMPLVFAGTWWAKAHDRAFDCEANWPEESCKVAE